MGATLTSLLSQDKMQCLFPTQPAMKNPRLLLLAVFYCSLVSVPNVYAQKTTVSIKGNQFYINDEITYKGQTWQGNKVEGLLMNSRMVQGIFDDTNPETQDRFTYEDTGVWSTERNTNEFVENMSLWKSYGLLAFTLNLQGGSPLGYGNNGWINSTFDPAGNLVLAYMNRLKKIMDEADRLGMVVILGYFYFGQDEYLTDEKAVVNAVDNMTNWLLDNDYRNVLVEVNNECNVRYDHPILQSERVQELIERVKNTTKNGRRLLVSTSYGGGTVPKENVVKVADYLLLHGNGIKQPERITELVDKTHNVAGFKNQPIVFNEDDHFDFDKDANNFTNAVRSYASWGYFDYRMKSESYTDGYQSVPVDWGINSKRKKAFFEKLKEVTGY
jgi:hypothetical protein